MPESTNLPSIGLSNVFFRTLGGLGAGLAGTIVLGIVLMLSWSVVGGTLSPADLTTDTTSLDTSAPDTHPLFLHFIMVAVFLACMAATMSYAFLMSVLEERYRKHQWTILTHTFFGNLVTLMIILPIYLIGSGIYGPAGIAATAVAHALLTTLFVYFTLSIFSTPRYTLMALYGSVLGLAFFLLFAFVLSDSSPTILSFLVLPVLLGTLSAGNGIAEMIYSWLRDTYGTDFLDGQKRFGDDYGVDRELAPEVDEDL